MANCVRWPFKWDVGQRPNHSVGIKNHSAFFTRARNEEALFQHPSLHYTPCPLWIILLYLLLFFFFFLTTFILCFFLPRGVQSCFIVIMFEVHGRGISRGQIMGSNTNTVFQKKDRLRNAADSSFHELQSVKSAFAEKSSSSVDVPRSNQVQVTHLGRSLPWWKGMVAFALSISIIKH